jgi:hypothetical protein
VDTEVQVAVQVVFQADVACLGEVAATMVAAAVG